MYRCDGPCIARRPYYGILRRAIERPPGPTDRWWARHEQECGGTFHKIEGPGAIPNAGSRTEMKTKQLIHTKVSASLNSSNNEYQYSDEFKTREDRIKRTQFLGASSIRKSEKGMKQPLSSFSRKSYDEEQVLQRIKAKHSNTKRSILLSKEETENALQAFQESRSKRGKSPEVGSLVDGRINRNYIPKSPHKLNLQKYLNRFLEAKKLQLHVPYEPKVLTVKSKLKVPNIQKYMNRLHEAKNLKTNLPRHDHKSSGHVVACTSSSDVISENRLSESLRKESKKHEFLDLDSSSSSVCPICNICVAATAYKQHLQDCFGDSLDSEMDMPCEERKTGKDNICSVKCTSEDIMEVENKWNQLEAKSCPNCGCLVLDAEIKLHLQYCIDSEDDDVDIESPGKTPGKNKNERELFDSLHEVAGVVTCPSCMEKVKENCIQEHLNECLALLSEEF